MKDLSYYLRRIFFLGAFFLAGFAFVEKIFNLVGYSLLGAQYTPWRLLEFSAISLLFVVVLQLREINISLAAKTTKEEPK
jgi:preprotein translocase subunit SecY